MSDHDPQLCDIEGCLECMPGSDQWDETAIRADERRKVIAELTAPMRADEPEIVQEVMEVMAAEYGASDNHTAHAVLDRIASLLAPESDGDGRNDKVLSADSGEKNIGHKSPAPPSPEPVREGDGRLVEVETVLAPDGRVDWSLTVDGVEHGGFASEPSHSEAVAAAAAYLSSISPSTAQAASAHEEGSTNG